LAVLALGALPMLLSDQIYWVLLLNLAGIYVIVNSGLDIVYGYSGQISIAQAGFYALGAYGSALLSARLGVPVALSIPLAALAAALCGALVAVPSVKLVHHFLAMVTIGFGEIVRLLLLNGGGLTGGPDGIVSIPRLEVGPLVFDSNRRYFNVILLSVAALLAIKARLVDSRIGRAFVAIRESPRAAAACGIDVQRYKVLAFAIGAFYAGVGGALYAHLIRFVSPETFSLEQSVSFLTMVLLGGAGTLMGPVLGTLIVLFLFEYLQAFGQAQMAVYGLTIIGVLFFMPRGLAGLLGDIARPRRRSPGGAE
jgi:branched-chain amino acid transport system permease protein